MPAAPIGGAPEPAEDDDDGGTTSGGTGAMTSGVTVGTGPLTAGTLGDPTFGADPSGTTATANTGGTTNFTTTSFVTSFPETTLNDSLTGDGNPVDSDGPITCDGSCDCPQFTRCVAGSCEPTTRVTFCCLDELCPIGEACETPDGYVGVCGYPEGY